MSRRTATWDGRFKALILGLVSVQFVWLLVLTAKVYPEGGEAGFISRDGRGAHGAGAWEPRGDGVAPPPPSEPVPSAGGEAEVAEAQALDALLQTTTDRLRQAAEAVGNDPADWVPDDTALAAARRAGSLDAPEVQAVIETLRQGYAHHGLQFPALGSTATQASGSL